MPRKANPMVGTQLLVPPSLRDRARALAIVMRCSVADVWRTALDGEDAGQGMSALETVWRPQLGDLQADLALLTNADAFSDALGVMIEKNMNAEDLKELQDFPW